MGVGYQTWLINHDLTGWERSAMKHSSAVFLQKLFMPLVNIKITNEGATKEQKAELIKGATELLQRVLHKNPQTTVVIIEEVSTDNWGIGGESVTDRRQKGK